MTAHIFGYITAKDEAEAERIGRMLVEKRLAACANLISGMKSIYRWQGKVETSQEMVVIIKTQAKHAESIVAIVKALHSAECPCVVFLPTEGGNPAFLKWIEENS